MMMIIIRKAILILMICLFLSFPIKEMVMKLIKVRRKYLKYLRCLPKVCYKPFPNRNSTIKVFESQHYQFTRHSVHNQALVTFFASKDFVPALEVFLLSFNSTNSRYPLIISIPALSCLDEDKENIPEDETVLISSLQAIMTKYSNLPYSIYLWPLITSPMKTNPRWRKNYSKLRMWEMIDYHKLLFIDLDVIFMSNIDEIFDMEMKGYYLGSYDYGRFSNITSTKMNGGVFLTKPSLQIFSDLVHVMSIHPQDYVVFEAEQGLFNYYFNKPYHCCIPYYYNSQKSVAKYLPKLWDLNKIKILHYIGEKPWKSWSSMHERNKKLSSHKVLEYKKKDSWDAHDYDGLHETWKLLYFFTRRVEFRHLNIFILSSDHRINISSSSSSSMISMIEDSNSNSHSNNHDNRIKNRNNQNNSVQGLINTIDSSLQQISDNWKLYLHFCARKVYYIFRNIDYDSQILNFQKYEKSYDSDRLNSELSDGVDYDSGINSIGKDEIQSNYRELRIPKYATIELNLNETTVDICKKISITASMKSLPIKLSKKIAVVPMRMEFTASNMIKQQQQQRRLFEASKGHQDSEYKLSSHHNIMLDDRDISLSSDIHRILSSSSSSSSTTTTTALSDKRVDMDKVKKHSTKVIKYMALVDIEDIIESSNISIDWTKIQLFQPKSSLSKQPVIQLYYWDRVEYKDFYKETDYYANNLYYQNIEHYRNKDSLYSNYLFPISLSNLYQPSSSSLSSSFEYHQSNNLRSIPTLSVTTTNTAAMTSTFWNDLASHLSFTLPNMNPNHKTIVYYPQGIKNVILPTAIFETFIKDLKKVMRSIENSCFNIQQEQEEQEEDKKNVNHSNEGEIQNRIRCMCIPNDIPVDKSNTVKSFLDPLYSEVKSMTSSFEYLSNSILMASYHHLDGLDSLLLTSKNDIKGCFQHIIKAYWLLWLNVHNIELIYVGDIAEID